MTDARLQQHERAWKASASVGDEVAYLRKRVRAGELKEERLRLAAYLGHAPSTQLVEPVPPAPSELDAWLDWITPDTSGELAVELLIAHRELTPDKILELSEGRIWRVHGCFARPKFLSPTIRRLRNRGLVSHDSLPTVCRPLPRGRRWLAVRHYLGITPGVFERLLAARYRAALEHTRSEVSPRTPVEELLHGLESWAICLCNRHLRWWKRQDKGDHSRRTLFKLAAHADAATRAQLQADVVPWLLGYGDPLARRVAARPGPPHVC